MVFILFLGATCDRALLLTDYMIASRVSAFQFLLLGGIYVSSISSCLGAMYGTPRVLQRYQMIKQTKPEIFCSKFTLDNTYFHKFYLLSMQYRIGKCDTGY